MAEKLIKPWNALPEGSAVTTDPEEAEKEGAVLVGERRLAHLRSEGFLPAPDPERVIRIEKEEG